MQRARTVGKPSRMSRLEKQQYEQPRELQSPALGDLYETSGGGAGCLHTLYMLYILIMFASIGASLGYIWLRNNAVQQQLIQSLITRGN